MPKKELAVGSLVTKKSTGQIGKIVNMYSENYIIELEDGDTFRHETVVVNPAILDAEYTVTHARTSALRFAAEPGAEPVEGAPKTEDEIYAYILENQRKAIEGLMTGAVTDRNPMPPSSQTLSEIKAFADSVAEEIAIELSGDTYTGAGKGTAESIAEHEMRPKRRHDEVVFQNLMRTLQGPAAARAQTIFQKQQEKLNARQKARGEKKAQFSLTDYVDPKYLESVAQAIWLKDDIVPSLQNMAYKAAKEVTGAPETAGKYKAESEARHSEELPAGEFGPSQKTPSHPAKELYDLIFKEPQAPDDIPNLNAEEQGVAKAQGQQNYAQQMETLGKVAVRLLMKMGQSPELKAMQAVLPSDTYGWIAKRLNSATTPAGIFETLIHYAVTVITTPRTGTTSEWRGGNPITVEDSKKKAKPDVAFPELAGFSPNPQERAMLSYAKRFKEALNAGDTASAQKYLQSFKASAAQWKKNYPDLIPTTGQGDQPLPDQKAKEDQFNAAMQEMNLLLEQHKGAAEERVKLHSPKSPASKSKAAPAAPHVSPVKVGPKISSQFPSLGFDAGQPVRYKGTPEVHYIVSYDDHNPLLMYLIKEQDVNSHDRAELIAASVGDVSPLRVYNVDIGDLVDAFGTIGRVTDASAKDLGYVYAELQGSHDIVPVELEKTAVTWQYATPIELCRCANDGGIVTPGQADNCPHHPMFGAPLMKPKGKGEPIMDAKANEETKKASIDLNAALQQLDAAAMFPAEKPAVELYEDESNPIEIGSTVKKFGTMTTGTVVGFKRNCCVVDWENGASESCWKQELVLVTLA